MLKHTLFAVLTAVMLQLTIPTGAVQAAPLQERVSNFIVQNPQVLQQVIEATQDLSKGDNTAALNKVVAAVTSSNSELGQLVSEPTLRESLQTQITQSVEAKIRQEVEGFVGDKLSPYQDQLTLLAQALTNK